MNFQIGIAKAAPMIVAVYALGNISGAHFNPAVSIAFALAKRFFWKESESNAVDEVTAPFVSWLMFMAPVPQKTNIKVPGSSEKYFRIISIRLRQDKT